MKEKIKMNNTTLLSGQEYSLNALFNGKNKIIIPDLQRDYCWGDKAWDKDKKTHTELVSNFVKNLWELFIENDNKKHTLGLIYGYENPKYNIQLCDGQQRITTLYLMLGSINRKTNNHFKENLISSFELDEDDKEPYLQYSIRESTLYFLSDLVCKFFLDNKVQIEDIRKQDWYFSEYDHDASIVSIIEALKRINEIITDKDNELEGFGKFIVENLQMIYYDMGNRARGEETFVVINTTGEPLTATENLKPILLGKNNVEKDDNDNWEEREQWFWKHRKGNGTKNNLIADNGYNEFLRWIYLIENYENEDYLDELKNKKYIELFKDLDLKSIHEYFKIVKDLFEGPKTDNNYLGIFSKNKDWLSPDIKDNYQNTLITLLKLLPVIVYKKKFKDAEKRDIIRVKYFFENKTRLEKVQKDVSSLLPEAIKLIKNLPNKDIASVIDLQLTSDSILNNEEKLKFKLYRNAGKDREQMEDLFWKAESHHVLNGEIQIIIDCVGGNNFEIDKFEKYYKVFNTLLNDPWPEELDITRRALLTQKLKNYPRIFKGWTNYSFCQKPSDWKMLITDNKEIFISFLHKLVQQDINNVNNIYKILEVMIDDYCRNEMNENDNWYIFVKNKKLLKYCEQKNIQIHGNLGIVLIKWEKASGPHINLKSYLLYLNLKEYPNYNNWELNFNECGKTCTYFKHQVKNINIDINYVDDDKYQIQIYNKKTQDLAEINEYELIQEYSLKEKDKRLNSELSNYDDIMELLKQLLDKLN